MFNLTVFLHCHRPYFLLVIARSLTSAIHHCGLRMQPVWPLCMCGPPCAMCVAILSADTNESLSHLIQLRITCQDRTTLSITCEVSDMQCECIKRE